MLIVERKCDTIRQEEICRDQCLGITNAILHSFIVLFENIQERCKIDEMNHYPSMIMVVMNDRIDEVISITQREFVQDFRLGRYVLHNSVEDRRFFRLDI